MAIPQLNTETADQLIDNSSSPTNNTGSSAQASSSSISDLLPNLNKPSTSSSSTPAPASSSSISDLLPNLNNKPIPQSSALVAGITAFNHGVESFISQLGTDKTVSDSDYNQSTKEHPTASLIGNIAAYGVVGAPLSAALPVSGMIGATSVLGKIGALAAEGGIQGGLLGAAQKPAEGGSRLVNAGISAAGGALGGGLLGTAAGIASQGGIRPTIANTLLRPDAEALAATGKEIGIPVGTGNLLKGGSAIRSASEVAPWNFMSTLGVNQQDSITPAITNLIGKITNKSDLSPQSFVTQFKTASNNSMYGIGGDSENIVGGIAGKYQQIAAQAKNLPGDQGLVDLSPLKQTINNILNEPNKGLLHNPNPNTSVIDTLQSYLKEPDKVPFERASAIKTFLGQAEDKVSGANADPEAAGALKRAFTGATSSLDNWGNNPALGNIYTDYISAGAQYQAHNVVFKTPQMIEALSNDSGMYKMIQQVITDRNPEHLAQLNNFLPRETQYNLQGAALERGLIKSTFKSDGGAVVNVGMLNKELMLGAKSGPVLWGDNLNKMKGVENLLSVIQGGTNPGVASSGILKMLKGGINYTAIKSMDPVMISGSIAMSAFTKVMQSPQLANTLMRWRNMTPSASSDVTNGLLSNTYRLVSQTFTDAAKKQAAIATGIASAQRVSQPQQ